MPEISSFLSCPWWCHLVVQNAIKSAIFTISQQMVVFLTCSLHSSLITTKLQFTINRDIILFHKNSFSWFICSVGHLPYPCCSYDQKQLFRWLFHDGKGDKVQKPSLDLFALARKVKYLYWLKINIKIPFSVMKIE